MPLLEILHRNKKAAYTGVLFLCTPLAHLGG